MRKMFFAFGLIFIVFQVGAQTDTLKVVILHTNDMHGKIDNYPKLAFLIDSIEQSNKDVLIFSAGDLVTGNPIVDKYEHPGYPMIDLMNMIGYDVSAIGNHEFDMSQNGFNYAMEKAKFPFICANLKVTNGELKQPKPFVKFKLANGLTVGVLSLIELEDNGMPASNPVHFKGITFYNPLQVAEKYRSYKDSVDIFIALTHLGFDTDKRLAEQMPGVFDAIVGGHSHTTLPNGFLEGNTLICQTGSYLRNLGVLTLKVYNGKVVDKSDKLISAGSASGVDRKVKAKVDKYNDNPEFNEVIATTSEAIEGKGELGNMITDAIIDTTHCDFAFVNRGGIRLNNLPKGNITKKDIFELSPFGNTYVVYRLLPCEIKHLVRYAYGLENRNELEVSGLKIKIILSKNGKVRRVKLRIANGNRLRPRRYCVVVNDYMTNAYMLKFLKRKANYTGIVDAGSIMNFLKKESPYKPDKTDRVQVIVR